MFLQVLPYIVAGLMIGLVLLLAWSYVSAVCRFILFDSVLRNECKLRIGWGRWKKKGFQYFLWETAFNAVNLLAFLVIAGVPAWAAWRAGIFTNTDQHIGALIIGSILVFLVLLGCAVASGVVEVLAKDFLVAVLALEELSVMDAWRRLLPIVRGEKMSLLGYLLMKLILTVGSSVLFGIINLIVIFTIVIVVGLLGLGVGLGAMGMGLSWNFWTIALAAIGGMVALVGVIWLLCLIYSPGLVFFQSYAQHYFGSRYAALGAILFPPPPPPVAAPETPAPPEQPPPDSPIVPVPS